MWRTWCSTRKFSSSIHTGRPNFKGTFQQSLAKPGHESQRDLNPIYQLRMARCRSLVDPETGDVEPLMIVVCAQEREVLRPDPIHQ